MHYQNFTYRKNIKLSQSVTWYITKRKKRKKKGGVIGYELHKNEN